MKKIIVALSLILIFGISLRAQNKEMTTVILKGGTKIIAYVEKTPSGEYVLTTEDGNVFYFKESEIKSVEISTPKESDIKHPKVKYRDLKKMYSAKDYHGREPGDKYSPAAMGVASFFVPGLGQYITGCQVGWGVMQTSFSIGGACMVVSQMINPNGAPALTAYTGLALWTGMAIWSCCSAVKAAKIKNLYYRDIKSGVAYNFELTPYFDVTTPVLASNQQYVAGLSFRVCF